MKFLVISSFKDTIVTVPPSIVKKAWELSADALNRDMKAGKILAFYAIPGQNRGISIHERGSAEELVEHFKSTPIATLVDFEVYPLADMEVWAKAFMETLELAEKMMPSPK